MKWPRVCFWSFQSGLIFLPISIADQANSRKMKRRPKAREAFLTGLEMEEGSCRHLTGIVKTGQSYSLLTLSFCPVSCYTLLSWPVLSLVLTQACSRSGTGHRQMGYGASVWNIQNYKARLAGIIVRERNYSRCRATTFERFKITTPINQLIEKLGPGTNTKHEPKGETLGQSVSLN